MVKSCGGAVETCQSPWGLWGGKVLPVEICGRILVSEETTLKVNQVSQLGGRAMKKLGH